MLTGKEAENNSSKLSELELAKRDAKDFKNLASLIKPSVVVIESVDRNGYEGGRGTGFVVMGRRNYCNQLSCHWRTPGFFDPFF